MPPQVVCVVGPTASGKTALGVWLAKHYNGEVVSCDSMQIYRRMDIGTAKPTREEMDGVPHHMIAVADPEEDYSAERYRREAVARGGRHSRPGKAAHHRGRNRALSGRPAQRPRLRQ